MVFFQEIFVVVNIWNLQCYSLIVLMFQLDIKILLDNVSILFDCSFGTYNDVFIDCFLIKFPLYKNTFGCNVSITFDCSFGTYNDFFIDCFLINFRLHYYIKNTFEYTYNVSVLFDCSQYICCNSRGGTSTC